MVYTYPKTIKEAVIILDKEYPNWRNEVDTYKLNMKLGGCCILGQLEKSWHKGMIKLFGEFTYDSYTERIHDKIFGSKADEEEWIKIIKIRSVLNDWNWALDHLEAGDKVRLSDWPNRDFLFVKEGNICCTGGSIYVFRPSVFRAVNWELFIPKPKLKDVKFGQKFQFLDTYIGLSTEAIFQRIANPANYANTTFINTQTGQLLSPSFTDRWEVKCVE